MIGAYGSFAEQTVVQYCYLCTTKNDGCQHDNALCLVIEDQKVRLKLVHGVLNAN